MSNKKDYPFLIQPNEMVPVGKQVSATSIENVKNLILNHNYSVGVYDEFRRSIKNWKKSNILILDIDEPQEFTIKELSKRLEKKNHVIAPTNSHLIAKGGKVACERYRLLIFLDDFIYSPQMYKEVTKVFASKYNIKFDYRALDASHYFRKSKFCESIMENGSFLSARTLVDEVMTNYEPNINELWQGYKESKQKIPDNINKLIESQRTGPLRSKFAEFIRILMGQHNLVWMDSTTKEIIGEGKIPIPQVHFAKTVRVDVRTFRKWLKLLVENEQLRVHSNFYGKGWTAKKYTAINDLREAVIKSYKELNTSSDLEELPDHIEDGDWDRILFLAALKFRKDSSPERYFRWARSLPNFYDKGDREHHIQHKWNCVKRFVE